MANCKKCVHSDICRNYEPISYSACSDFKDKSRLTNYDRIKAMSVEEMSDFLMDFFMEALTNPKWTVVKNWLESEMKE